MAEQNDEQVGGDAPVIIEGSIVEPGESQDKPAVTRDKETAKKSRRPNRLRRKPRRERDAPNLDASSGAWHMPDRGADGPDVPDPVVEGVILDDEPAAEPQDPEPEPITIDGEATAGSQQETQQQRERQRRAQEQWEAAEEQERQDRASSSRIPDMGSDDPWFEHVDTSAGEPSFEEGLTRTDNPLDDLQTNAQRAAQAYMAHVRNGGLIGSGEEAEKPVKQRMSKLTDMQKAYGAMMALSVMDSMRRGTKAQGVFRAVGMVGGLYALSPVFRGYASDNLGTAWDGLKSKLEERADNDIARRASKERAKVGRKTAKSEAKGKPLSKRWAKRKAEMEAWDLQSEMKERGRGWLTTQEAAMTIVGLDQSLFINMREEGVDREALMTQHTELLQNLYNDAQEDGLDLEEIATKVRVLTGQSVKDNPQMAAMYTELAHGTFVPTEPREVRLPNGQEAKIWEGGFRNGLHQEVDSGVFSVRPPMDAQEHEAAITDAITADLLGAKDEGDVQAAIVGYMGGYHFDPLNDPGSVSGMDPKVVERINKSATIKNTMDLDGYSDEAQREIYSNAYMNALELTQYFSPKIEEQWSARYGERWKEDIAEMSVNAERFAAEKAKYSQPRNEGPSARHHGRTHYQPSGRRSQTYRRALLNQSYNETDQPPSVDFEMGG